MKKEWLNPEIKNLEVASTNEGTCFCEAGAVTEAVVYKNGKPHRPGHNHKPGNPCPDQPKPNPDPDPTPAS